MFFNPREKPPRRCRHELVQANVFKWLADSHAARHQLVILDPPALAKKASDVPAAIRGYRDLVRLALPRPAKGGVLSAFSCSAPVPADDFFKAVIESVQRSGRSAVELERTFQPSDHAATFPEARYLKG